MSDRQETLHWPISPSNFEIFLISWDIYLVQCHNLYIKIIILDETPFYMRRIKSVLKHSKLAKYYCRKIFLCKLQMISISEYSPILAHKKKTKPYLTRVESLC